MQFWPFELDPNVMAKEFRTHLQKVWRNVGWINGALGTCFSTPRWDTKFKARLSSVLHWPRLHKNTDQNDQYLEEELLQTLSSWLSKLSSTMTLVVTQRSSNLWLQRSQFSLAILGHPTGGPGLREFVDRKIPNKWAYGYGWYAISWRHPGIPFSGPMTTWFFQKHKMWSGMAQRMKKLRRNEKLYQTHETLKRQQCQKTSKLGPTLIPNTRASSLLPGLWFCRIFSKKVSSPVVLVLVVLNAK